MSWLIKMSMAPGVFDEKKRNRRRGFREQAAGSVIDPRLGKGIAESLKATATKLRDIKLLIRDLPVLGEVDADERRAFDLWVSDAIDALTRAQVDTESLSRNMRALSEGASAANLNFRAGGR